MDKDKKNYYIDKIIENCENDLAIDKCDSMIKYIFSIVSDEKERTELIYVISQELKEVFYKGLTFIPYSFLKGCNEIHDVTIPENIKQIGLEAFRDCENLEKVVIEEGVKEIGNCAFSSCHKLKVVVLPNTINEISIAMFNHCYSLEEITIPNTVTSIEDDAFNSCKSLKSIKIPNSVLYIGKNAFLNCENITIYCEAKSKPNGWDDDWNPGNRPVVWGII